MTAIGMALSPISGFFAQPGRCKRKLGSHRDGHEGGKHAQAAARLDNPHFDFAQHDNIAVGLREKTERLQHIGATQCMMIAGAAAE